LCCHTALKIPAWSVYDAIIQSIVKNIERTWNEEKRNFKNVQPRFGSPRCLPFFHPSRPLYGSWPRSWKPLFYDMNITLLGMTWSAEVFNEETNFCFQTNKKYFKPTYMAYEVSKQTCFELKVLLLRTTKAYVKRKSKNKRQIKPN